MLKRGVFLVILACCSIGLCQSAPNTPPISQANTPAIAPTVPQPAQPQLSPAVNTPDPNAQQKSSGNFWSNKTTANKLTFVGLILAAITILVSVCYKKTSGNSAVIKIGDNNSGQTTGIIDSKGGPITISQGDSNLLADKLIAQSEKAGKLEGEIGTLKNDLGNALNRVRELENGGRRDDAVAALEAIRKSGNAAQLQTLLITDRDLHKNAMIERNREISAVAYLRGDIDIALAAVDEILKLLPDDLDALNRKGHICKLRGNLPEAIECYEKVLSLAKTQNDESWQAAALGNLGIVYQTQGELDKAVGMYNKALAIETKLGSQEGMAIQYGNLGIVYQIKGEFDKAVQIYNKALAINEKLGRLESMASHYGNLGNVYQIRGDLDNAVDMYNKSLAINEKLGRQEGIAIQYGNLGNVYQIKGELDNAVEMYNKALTINENLGRPEGMANQYGNLGIVYQTKGDKTKSREYYLKSIGLFRKVGIEHTAKKVEDLLKKLDEK